MIKSIIKRDGRIVQFNREKIVFAVSRALIAVGDRSKFIAENIADKVIIYFERIDSTFEKQGGNSLDFSSVDKTEITQNITPTVEEVQDIVEKVLIAEGYAKTAKAYIIYRYEHALKRKGRPSLAYSFDNVPYKTLWETLSWASEHQCTRLRDLKEFIEKGQFNRLVAVSETFYDRQISIAAQTILEGEKRCRLIVVAGPSSSGKTTTSIRLREKIESQGRKVFVIAADNYFYDLDQHPVDAQGDYDFETPQALNIELLNKDILRILKGEKVLIPQYDFKLGKQIPEALSVKIDSDTLLLIDSLHGLYPLMTKDVPGTNKILIYAESLSQMKDSENKFLRWSDVRMLRRMVRDSLFRNYDMRQTVLHWRYVRRSEMRYIISRLHSADVIINTFLAYELPLLKQRVEGEIKKLFNELQSVEDHDFEDAFTRLKRISLVLSETPSIRSSQSIPENSLIREFIGGSSYQYD